MNLFLFVLFLVMSVQIGLSKHEYKPNYPKKRVNASPKHTNTFEYYTKHDVINIPVMVHLDKMVTRNLSKEYKTRRRAKAKNLLRTIFHDVQTMFRRPSLQQPIKFELIDVKFLKNATNKFVMDENVSNTMKSYCQWQSEKKKGRRRWWYSVLFTGLDLFYYGKDNKKVWSTTGRSFMNGICSLKHSCSILEWKRTNIHQKLAHELAHTLGISHDVGPCQGNYIMAPKYKPAERWSRCSKRDLQSFLVNPLSWCIRPGLRH